MSINVNRRVFRPFVITMFLLNALFLLNAQNLQISEPEIPGNYSVNGDLLIGPPSADPEKPDIYRAIKDYESGIFSRADKSMFFGAIPDGRWFLLPFSINSSSGVSMIIFQIENYLIDSIDLFIVKEGQVINYQEGGALSRSTVKHLGFVTHDFPVELEGGDYSAFFYVRTDEAFFPLKVFNFRSYNDYLIKRETLYALFYGFIFAVFITGIFPFIYLESNRKYFTYHFLVQIFFILYQLSRDGILDTVFWPGNGYLIHRFYLFATAFALLFLQYLVISFFCLRKMRPRLYYFLKLNLLIPVLAVIGLFLIPEPYIGIYKDYSRFFIIYILILQLVVTFAGLFSKDSSIRFFSIGWQFAIIGFLVAALKAKGILPYPYFQFYALSGLLLEGGFFIIATSVRFKSAAEEKRQTESALKEADHRLLQSRGRPHFLMNTFNLIHSLIESSPKQADEAFRKMIVDFQFFTTKATLPLVPVNEEIEFTKNYISIMKLRFGSQLSIDSNCRDEYDKYFVPPLSFQPLVENALKYSDPVFKFKDAGEKNQDSFKQVFINLFRRGNLFHFEVRNSTILEDVENYEPGITHKNIISRLEYYFPDAIMSLNVKSGIFSVIIKWTDAL